MFPNRFRDLVYWFLNQRFGFWDLWYDFLCFLWTEVDVIGCLAAHIQGLVTFDLYWTSYHCYIHLYTYMYCIISQNVKWSALYSVYIFINPSIQPHLFIKCHWNDKTFSVIITLLYFESMEVFIGMWCSEYEQKMYFTCQKHFNHLSSDLKWPVSETDRPMTPGGHSQYILVGVKKEGLRHGHNPKKGGRRTQLGTREVLRSGLVKKTILVTDVAQCFGSLFINYLYFFLSTWSTGGGLLWQD